MNSRIIVARGQQLLVVVVVVCLVGLTAAVDVKQQLYDDHYPAETPSPNATTLAPNATHAPTPANNNNHTAAPTMAPSSSNNHTNHTAAPTAHNHTPTAAPMTAAPNSKAPITAAPSRSPTHVPIPPDNDHPKKHVSFLRIIGKTIAWLILIMLSVVAFGAVMSNRYRIYFFLRGCWYTFVRLDCTVWILAKLRAGRSSVDSSLNTIIFDNEMTEGLLMRESTE
jgi:hypothetical protein